MDDIQLSVIVPVYNVPQMFLSRCLDSLTKQTDLNRVEVIVIDDGSDEKTVSFLDDYVNDKPLFQLIHQKNTGLSGARNSGQRLARGDYFIFVDSDDYLDIDAICKIKDSIQKHSNADLILFATNRDANGKLKRINDLSFFENNKLTKEQWLKEYLIYDRFITSAYSKVYNRLFMSNNGLYHNSELRQGAEGIEFNFRVFEKANEIVAVNDAWYYYVYNSQSISSFQSLKNTELTTRCFESIENDILSNHMDYLKEYFYTRFLYVIVTTFISSIYHPKQKLTYRERKKVSKDYLNQGIVKSSFKYGKTSRIDGKRRTIIWLIKHHCMLFLFAIGKMRNIEKNSSH